MTVINGARILVTGGATKEAFDDVRHISNSSRSLDHGHRVATELARQGAKVTLVSTKTHLPQPRVVKVIDTKTDGSKIISTNDLKEAIDTQLLSDWFDTVVHLSVIPSIKPRKKQQGKVKRDKSKTDITIPVEGNIDLLDHIKKLNKAARVVGYDQRQNLKTVTGAHDLEELIRQELHSERVSSSETTESKPQATQKLLGKKIIVTSGRTEEPVTSTGDVITNFASGRQGHAIAQALADMGASVVLVTGPTLLPDPKDKKITTVHIKSATELRDTTLKQLPADAAVCVCAVTNFGTGGKPLTDLNLGESEVGSLFLDLMPDTLASLGKHVTRRPQVVVGFAAETDNLIEYAKGKLSKGVDLIVANNVAVAKDNDRNKVAFISSETCVNEQDEMSKYDVGLSIGEKIAALLS